MRIKYLILLLLFSIPFFGQEEWRITGPADDFNRAAYGIAVDVGRKPLVVKGDDVFFFHYETNYVGSSTNRFVTSKFDGSWEHLEMPVIFSDDLAMDCTVDGNEIPYIFFNDPSAANLPVVLKYEGGNWVNVGTDISQSTSSLLNISIGTDNLPQILFREGGEVKLKKFDGSAWVLISATTEFIPYTKISLELDNNNIPYIVSNYQVGTTFNCFVRKFNGTAWEEVGITGFEGEGKSLIFDSSNTPTMIVGNTIKKFTVSSWDDFAATSPAAFPHVGGQLKSISFNAANELYVGFVAQWYMNSSQGFYLRKLVGDVWQTVINNGFQYDLVFTLSGDSVYTIIRGPGYYPKISKKTGDAPTEILGDNVFIQTGMEYIGSSTHDFSICNGIPMIAHLDAGKASVKWLVNDQWIYLGAPQFSENAVTEVFLRSGTDGNIYAAYNNQLSTTASDTKITVKKLGTSGWETVGSENFSLSAGAQFDFALSSTNEPYVLYMSGRLQKFDGTSWVFVGSSAYVGDTPARLALDSNDVPYIAFKDASNGGRVTVKKLNGSVWEYVDLPGLMSYSQGYLPRICFDSSNNLYLGFADNLHRVYVKKLNGGVWESVGNELFTIAQTDHFEIAVDNNNILHIVYNEVSNNFRQEANVKKFNGTDWEFVGDANFSPGSVLQAKIDFTLANTPMVGYSFSASTNEYYVNVRYFGDENALSTTSFSSARPPKIVITPNPVRDSFKVDTDEHIESITIFDLLGKEIMVNTTSTNTDVSSLLAGIYLVKVKTKNGIQTLKVVKE